VTQDKGIRIFVPNLAVGEIYALDDLYDNDLETAEKRIDTHISVLETAKNHLAPEPLADDIITLKNFSSLAQNLGKKASVSDNSPPVRALFFHGLNLFGQSKNGFVQRAYYGR